IGGIGMSGIAEILHNLGYAVQGSDVSASGNVDRLRQLGIKVMVGPAAENIEGAGVVVKSTAVKFSNPEIAAAQRTGIPVVRRSEMLRELMRLKLSIAVAGTHGKTTTTTIMGAVMSGAGLDPTIINGGIINSYGTNAKLGKGDWMVVEADESDGTFLKIPSTIAVVTNIDPEHLDHYKNFDNLKAAFKQFIEGLPFYGFAVACIDHPEVRKLAKQVERRTITYGTHKNADIRAVNITSGVDGSRYDVEIRSRGSDKVRTLKGVRFPVPGMHNVRNSLVAVAIANELEIDDSVVLEALGNFKGVKRRFTRTGEAGGITIIDDYGHHPVEIAATLSAARAFRSSRRQRVIAVVQPHRFTRLRDLFDQFCTCFSDADMVIVADVYTAGEEPIRGIHRDALVKGIKKAGHKAVYALSSPDDLAALALKLGRSGDMVVCLGAGSITGWANALPAQMDALLAPQKKAS
ncbi:MAG: UDP-N-acetylmuramate--L-alanine ligase, partial [Alphaproteobacteria bacterium]|nr:UDP-N-acetylmuramate--L-alanine ligase [Alphaproteobacteria bacterium]